MRWPNKRHREGDVWTQKHRQFLIWPRTIKGETRWLEWAEWESKATETLSADFLEWKVERWVN